MRPLVLAVVVAAAVSAVSCCPGGPFESARHLVAHGRVLHDDGSPAPGAQVRLCANDGYSGPYADEPSTCVEGITDANGAYQLEVGNVAPRGSDCRLHVTDSASRFGGIDWQVTPPPGWDDPMRVEVRDLHLGTPGSQTFLEDLQLSIEDGAIRTCTPRALHRCVLYASYEGSVRVWPPTDLEPVPDCEHRAAPPVAGADARRAGIFVEEDAVPSERHEPSDGGLLLQCEEGRFALEQ